MPRPIKDNKKARPDQEGRTGVKAAGCHPKKTGCTGHGWQCGREMAGTGTETTRCYSGKQGVESFCDAECDAISGDRVEVLARAVVLVAGMNIPEAAWEAVLTLVTAELANTAKQSPRTSARAGESTGR